MFQKSPIKVLTILMMLAVFLTACSDDGDNPAETSMTGTDNYEGMDFALPYGGLTVSDENEAFNDESLQTMMYAEDGEEYDDPISADEVQELEDQGNQPGDPNDPNRPRFTFLRLRWGMVTGPEDTLNVPVPPCDITDWSGEIRADRGIVRVRRVIRFERPEDHIVRPRQNPQTVEFVSHTTCHFDGLLLQIIERPGDYDPDNTEPNRLHINAGPYTGVYEMEALAGFNEIIEVDDQGNLMQLNGFNLSDLAYCPKGFLAGRYRPVPEDGSELITGSEEPGTHIGRMAGVYTDLTGRIKGFMRGGYGLDADGNRVFFAKYIGRRGGFRGLISGTWEPAEDERNLHSFEGRWVSASGNIDGLLGGMAHSIEDIPGGFYEGRWTAICDDEAEGQVH